MTLEEAKDILNKDKKCKEISNHCLMVDCEWCEYFCLAYEVDKAEKIINDYSKSNFKRN